MMINEKVNGKKILEINLLSPERKIHSFNTAKLAKTLAKKFNYHHWAEELYLAGLLHDLAKEWKAAKIFHFYQQHQLDFQQLKTLPRKVWHGSVGAFYCQKKLKITDQTFLDAIRYHTTAKKNFSPFGKILFIADKLEPAKKEVFFLHARKNLFKKQFTLDSLFNQTLAAVYQKLLTQQLVPTLDTREAYQQYCQD